MFRLLQYIIVKTNKFIQKNIMNLNPNIYNLHHNLHHHKTHQRKPIFQTNTPSAKITMHKLPQALHQEKQTNDYELQRRKTLKFIPFNTTNRNKIILTENKEIASRIQRGSEPSNSRNSRQNHFINPQDFLNNSRQKLKVLSNSKGSSFSRSENSSARKLRGIELTKSKGISGMYNQKDFEVRQSFTNLSQKTNEANPINGKIIDQYQINDYQTPTKMVISHNHLHLTQSRSSNSQNLKNQHQNNISKQTAEQIINRSNLQQSKGKVIQPQRQLLKARSYDIMPNKISSSNQIRFHNMPVPLSKPQAKPQPQPQPQHQPQNIYHSSQNLFSSKRKTLQQLSLKQSLLIEFDPYHR